MSVIADENVAKLLKQKSYQIDTMPMGQDTDGVFIVKANIKIFEDGGRIIELANKTVKESTMIVVKDVVGFAKGADEVEASNNAIIATSALLGL